MINSYLYESLTFSRILKEYQDVLHQEKIDREAFEKGVQWFYHQVLERLAPVIHYCDSPAAIDRLDIKSTKINRLTVESALMRHFNRNFEYKDRQIEYVFIKRRFKEELQVENYRIIRESIDSCHKNGLNLKKELAMMAYRDYDRQWNRILVPNFQSLKNFICSGVHHVFFWKDAVVALTQDPSIRLNEMQLLHHPVYPALEWPQGPRRYFIYGREMPQWIFTQYGTENLYQRFLKEGNEDIRSGIITMIKEREGERGVLEFLKAELVDEKKIEHFPGYTEILRLYKTKEKFERLLDHRGRADQPYCWSEFTCPSTGSTYILDNSAHFTDALKAARFLRPSFVPNTLAYKWSHDAC